MGIFSEEEPKEKPKKQVSKTEKLEEGKILCRTVIELLGKPKDYIVDTMHKYVEKIKQNKEIEVVKAEFSDPVEKEGLFGMFVDLEAWFKHSETLIDFCFDYMPSSIEVVEPSRVTYTSNKLSNMFNDLQAKLHTIDMMLKNTVQENKILRKNAAGLLRNNIMLSIKEKPKKIDEISRNVGVPANQLKPFLDKVIEEGHLKENKGTYSLIEQK